MITKKFETREEWLLARRGKLTGSRVKDVVVKRGTGEKIGFYELIAERLAVEPDGENPMDRGNRLEEEALERFIKETGKKGVDGSLVTWYRDEDESIAISPDAFIKKENSAIEIKCLNSALHIKTWLTQEIPEEYKAQRLQYFVVNDKLKTLYHVFYDPRIAVKDYFVIVTKREDVQAEVEQLLAYERELLSRVDEIVNQLTY